MAGRRAGGTDGLLKDLTLASLVTLTVPILVGEVEGKRGEQRGGGQINIAATVPLTPLALAAITSNTNLQSTGDFFLARPKRGKTRQALGSLATGTFGLYGRFIFLK